MIENVPLNNRYDYMNMTNFAKNQQYNKWGLLLL